MNLLPAVVVGGPPHSGKSVLTYALAQALRDRKVEHYVLRAAPDADGLWLQESDYRTVQHIRERHKGQFNPDFIAHIRRSIVGRHLPLIVDVGGRPQHEQLKILGESTHTLLLYQTEADLREWRDYFARYDHLIAVAEVQSAQSGSDRIDEQSPVLTGVLTGLERGVKKSGAFLNALADRLAGIFNYSTEELVAQHLTHSPVPDLIVLIERAIQLGLAPRGAPHHNWLPEQLPALIQTVAPHTPLAVYGRGPNWVYGALAAHALPAAYHLFDVRLGWTQARELDLVTQPESELLNFQTHITPQYSYLDIKLKLSFLDYLDLRDLRLPEVRPDRGLVISGPLPHWLWTTLVRSYRSRCQWIALYQPLLKGPAVVCASDVDNTPIGSLIPIPDALLTASKDTKTSTLP